MNIELRAVKYAAFASQETHCFSATVYIDGAKAGTVSNEGHGGCNDYSNGLRERLNKYAATLPPTPVPSQSMPGLTIAMDADILIGDLVNDWLLARDLKRALSTRFLYIGREGTVLQSKRYPAAKVAHWLKPENIEKVRSGMKCPGQFFNEMPFAEALKLYTAAIRKPAPGE